MNIDTNGAFEISKVGERVFQIGLIVGNQILKDNIINILDKGFKYIPNYNNNPVNFFKSIICNLEDEMSNLNKQFFLKDQSFQKKLYAVSNSNNNIYSHVNIIDSNDESILDENFSHESLENFLAFKKRINTKDNLNNLNISKNSIFFQLELFKELNNLKFNVESNLSRDELIIFKKIFI